MLIDNDPRPGRPRTPTYERSVKLVADALEEDHHAICEELSRATGAKTSQENAQEPTSSCPWMGHSFSMALLACTHGCSNCILLLRKATVIWPKYSFSFSFHLYMS